MSYLATHDHDTNPARLRARVDACATVAFGATGATTTSTELDSLTGEAGAWLASLPAPVRVHELVNHAPDIANQLAASWNDVPSTALLLKKLLADCGVQSLPPMVARELLRLHEYHVRCRTNDAPDTTWELPVFGLQNLQPTAVCRGSHP